MLAGRRGWVELTSLHHSRPDAAANRLGKARKRKGTPQPVLLNAWDN